MTTTLAQLNGWVSIGRSVQDLVYASSERSLPTRGKSADELLTKLVETISLEMVTRGPNADANLSPEFEKIVQAAFTAPRQQPQRAAPAQAAHQAAASPTPPTSGMPSFWANPWKYLTYTPPPKDGNDKTGAFMRWWQAHW